MTAGLACFLRFLFVSHPQTVLSPLSNHFLLPVSSLSLEPAHSFLRLPNLTPHTSTTTLHPSVKIRMIAKLAVLVAAAGAVLANGHGSARGHGHHDVAKRMDTSISERGYSYTNIRATFYSELILRCLFRNLASTYFYVSRMSDYLLMVHRIILRCRTLRMWWNVLGQRLHRCVESRDFRILWQQSLLWQRDHHLVWWKDGHCYGSRLGTSFR